MGSWFNLLGQDIARAIARAALAYGYTPVQTRLEKPLAIQGVGEGSQLCEWQASLTIASPDENGNASPNTFEAPVVGG